MWLLFIFIGIPIIEIGLFIEVGSLIGLWPTLAIIFLTAIIGLAMVRSQGAQVMQNLQRAMEQQADPSEPLAHGAMILFSGLLLLTPGFFTDAVGFALLIPGVRDHVFRFMASRVKLQGVQMGAAGTGHRPTGRPDVIDGEFQELDPDNVPPRPGERPSGWIKD